MSTELLQKLMDDYVTGTISPDDRQRLLSLFMDPVLSEEARAFLLQDLQTGRYDSEDIPELRERLQGRLHRLINSSSLAKPAHRVHFLRSGWFRYAAAIIIMLGVGSYLWVSNNKTEQKLAHGNGNKQLQTDVPPGGEKAVLTLADGTKIILDSAANGNLAQQGNAAIVKLANGQIAYNLKGLAGSDVMMNTMTTPKGGQYQLTLPDGTKAWLNAASSITYPAAFIGTARNVKISGEVYFEVAKNKQQPFIVDVDGKSLIEVLGTSFNINSYSNEDNIRTTLVEGSVSVVQGSKKVVLKPGQQATIGNSAGITVNTHVDLDQIVAWKNGVFDFNRLSLPAVMRQLERWYDIKVEYKGSLSKMAFEGKMYRNVNLSFVLAMLKEIGVRFELDGKTLTVL